MIKPKKKIASDIDDVLFESVPQLNRYYNRRFGTNLSLEDYKHFDLEKVWGCTRLEAVQIVSDFYGSEEFKRILPLKDAPYVVRDLAQKSELSAITLRPKFILGETLISLNGYFGNAFSDIFSNGQYGVNSTGLDKSGYCLSKGISTILEDNLDIAKKCAEKGMLAVLFDKSWNQAASLPRGIIRVGETGNHWMDAREILK